MQRYYKFLECTRLRAKIIVYARISVYFGTKDCRSHDNANVFSKGRVMFLLRSVSGSLAPRFPYVRLPESDSIILSVSHTYLTRL